MKFTLACNWDLKLLDGLENTEVVSLFGGIPNSIIAGGRASFVAPQADPAYVREYIVAAHKKGLKFNLLLNASCLDNKEYTRQGHRAIMEHLEWVVSVGADEVTVALPYLLELIKFHFPRLKVKISSFARIDGVQKAKYWEDLGADSLMLPENMTRDFKTLRQIRKAVKCDLELIANPGCLFGCPRVLYHQNTMTHGSQSDHPSQGFMIDHSYLSCTNDKMKDPREIVKIRWIRPEDVDYYAQAGIDVLKIIDRYKTTELLHSYVKSYQERKFEGNIVELLNLPRRSAFLPVNLQYLMREELVNTEKIMGFADCCDITVTELVNLDNRKIPADFINFFEEVDCARVLCEECGYCYQVAQQALSVDSKALPPQQQKFDRFLGSMLAGEIYREEQGIPQDGKVHWQDAALHLQEDLLAVVPFLLKKVADRMTRRGAEGSARERKSTWVEPKDVVRGWAQETPGPFKPELMKKVKELGMEEWLEGEE